MAWLVFFIFHDPVAQSRGHSNFRTALTDPIEGIASQALGLRLHPASLVTPSCCCFIRAACPALHADVPCPCLSFPPLGIASLRFSPSCPDICCMWQLPLCTAAPRSRQVSDIWQQLLSPTRRTLLITSTAGAHPGPPMCIAKQELAFGRWEGRIQI